MVGGASKIMELDQIYSSDSHAIALNFHSARTVKSDTICILMHGMFSDKNENGRFAILASLLNEAGFDVLCFDFRGHGESSLDSSKFTISGALNDLAAVVSSVNSQNYRHVNLIASSFFSCVAVLYLASPSRKQVSKLALFNPVVDFEKSILHTNIPSVSPMISDALVERIEKNGEATLSNGFVVSREFLSELRNIKPYSYIENIEIPLVVYHGTLDETVDVRITKEYFSNKEKCDLHIIEGGTHAFKNQTHQQYVFQHLRNWLGRI